MLSLEFLIFNYLLTSYFKFHDKYKYKLINIEF